MQKLRDLAFLSLIDGLYGSMYTQRMMQDDTQGCLQAVQREHRVSSSHSHFLSHFFIAHAQIRTSHSMDSENARD